MSLKSEREKATDAFWDRLTKYDVNDVRGALRELLRAAERRAMERICDMIDPTLGIREEIDDLLDQDDEGEQS